MNEKHDLTMMYTMHDALRRELSSLARAAASERGVSSAAVGWELFEKALHAHHTVEDEVLWPVMREAVAGRARELALLDAMQAEHAAIDPLLASIDAALAGRAPRERLVELAEALAAALTAHLDHEERDVLALVDATVTAAQWQRFGEAHSARIGPDAPRILPWLLDGASPERTASILGRLPEPVRSAYQDAWWPAHAALDLWAGPA